MPEGKNVQVLSKEETKCIIAATWLRFRVVAESLFLGVRWPGCIVGKKPEDRWGSRYFVCYTTRLQ